MKSQSIIINEREALNALDGNSELLCDLAQIFIEDFPSILDELDKAIRENRHDDAKRAIHSLKGLSSTFFAKQTTDLAWRLEGEVCDGSIENLRHWGASELRRSVEALAESLRICGLVK